MENPKCPYCGGEMRYAFNGDIVGTHFFICEACLSRSPAVSFNDDPYAAAMKRVRAKGSMSLYIYKKLGEWLGAPCNLSFGELCVGEFFTRYCGDFCDDCNSEYGKCWKKFFETLEETEVNDEQRFDKS